MKQEYPSMQGELFELGCLDEDKKVPEKITETVEHTEAAPSLPEKIGAVAVSESFARPKYFGADELSQSPQDELGGQLPEVSQKVEFINELRDMGRHEFVLFIEQIELCKRKIDLGCKTKAFRQAILQINAQYESMQNRLLMDAADGIRHMQLAMREYYNVFMKKDIKYIREAGEISKYDRYNLNNKKINHLLEERDEKIYHSVVKDVTPKKRDGLLGFLYDPYDCCLRDAHVAE